MDAARRTLLATTAALIGFAANSLLCRMALGASSADAWSFTAIRLGAGALTLAALARISAGSAQAREGGNWTSAVALFAYAAAFSLAYLRLSTGTGALVLFASVQATMIGWGILRGARPALLEWAGIAVALAGLALLTLPGATAPDPLGLSLMVVAGAAWGAYSLRGRASRSPLAATAGNFMRSVPFALAGLAVGFAGDSLHVGGRGAALAVASGALASGVGYSLWYLALPGLTATRAAVVQLVVPVLAALAGIALLGESATPRLVAAGALILGGVATTVLGRH